MANVVCGKMINIGNGHYIFANDVVMVLKVGSTPATPVKRFIANAAEDTIIDLTNKEGTNSLIVLRQGKCIRSTLTPPTIVKRISEAQ